MSQRSAEILASEDSVLLAPRGLTKDLSINSTIAGDLNIVFGTPSSGENFYCHQLFIKFSVPVPVDTGIGTYLRTAEGIDFALDSVKLLAASGHSEYSLTFDNIGHLVMAEDSIVVKTTGLSAVTSTVSSLSLLSSAHAEEV